MSDKESRVLGSGQTLTIAGKEYRISPINMGHLQELQREAVASYKRQVLETYGIGLEYMGPMGPKIMQEQIEKLSKVDIDSIPRKKVYEVGHIPVTGDLKSVLAEEYGVSCGDFADYQILSVLSSLVDSEQISPQRVHDLTGHTPKIMQVPYDTWWVNGTVEGMVCMIYLSLRKNHPDIRKSEIQEWGMEDIQIAARSVESITRPDVGNT